MNTYNKPSFIATDPISIPQPYTDKRDREIAGFWRLPLPGDNVPPYSTTHTNWSDGWTTAPHQFILQARFRRLETVCRFCTPPRSTATIVLFFMAALRHIYTHTILMWRPCLPKAWPPKGICLEPFTIFAPCFWLRSICPVRANTCRPTRSGCGGQTHQHVFAVDGCATIGKRRGFWLLGKPFRPPVLLLHPLDVHSGRTVPRKLGLLTRTQDDRQVPM